MASGVSLGLVILAVQDLSRAVRFYRAAFEWAQTVHTAVYAEFALPGNQRIGLYARRGFSLNIGQMPVSVPQGEIGGTELYFYTDEFSTTITRLETVGARVLSASAIRDWGDEAAYFADPDGNVLVIARPVKDE